MDLLTLLSDLESQAAVDRTWEQVSADFEAAYRAMPVKYMARTELSFHDKVKLLAYLALVLRDVPGAIVEIGVWKGKSLTLMTRVAGAQTKVIGIDPCELPGQPQELEYFWRRLYPQCSVIRRYSQDAVEETLLFSRALKLLHIDGGHKRENVWADFLLYERFIVPGGYIVFDDYTDVRFSPEVGPAIDRLREAGLFTQYDIVGQLPGYESSYVLCKRAS